MAFPQVTGTNTSAVTSAGTSHSVSLPSNISAGELLLVVFSTAASSNVGTTSFPAGWDSVLDVVQATRSRLTIYKRIATGSEGASITVTTSASVKSAHNTYRISGHNEAAIESDTAQGFDKKNPNPPSVAPSWGADDTLWFVALATSSPPTVSSYPADYGNALSINTSGTANTDTRTSSARRELNASSEDPGAFTLSGQAANYVVATLAVQPGAAGPANLKTWNGIAKANIKTINGVPIANVKTIDGVA